jgi:post-segregation antitoxin (ccd killing protein)
LATLSVRIDDALMEQMKATGNVSAFVKSAIEHELERHWAMSVQKASREYSRKEMQSEIKLWDTTADDGLDE